MRINGHFDETAHISQKSNIMGAIFIFMFSILSYGLDLGKANDFTTGHIYPCLKKLYDKMLSNYDKRILPKCTNDPVNVTIQLAPREIVDITEPLEVAIAIGCL